GIEFFKTCMNALQLKKRPYHIMFMPCSNWIKYGQRFKRLDWYIGKHRQDLTSGLYDVDICDARESLHEAKGGEKRILERNYLITGKIKGKEIIIIDDVLTTGQSVADYKEEIERCGGKVVAAIFYGKTLSMPSMLLVQIHVWGNHIAHIIERMTK
ncbi:phosphoribosyltransferase family protein, partial [Bacteroides fragilis]